MNTTQSSARSPWLKLAKIITIVLAAVIVVALLIKLSQVVQQHTEGGEGGTNGGDVPSGAPMIAP